MWEGCNSDDVFTVVETTVKTTVGQIDAVWERLNEYDINAKLASKCLPPAVIKYGDLKTAFGTKAVSPDTNRPGFLYNGLVAMSVNVRSILSDPY